MERVVDRFIYHNQGWWEGLLAMVKKQDEETLHDFRLGIKRMLSLWSIYPTFLQQKQVQKDIHELTRLFKTAGQIRKLQLLKQWLEENELAIFSKDFHESVTESIQSEVAGLAEMVEAVSLVRFQKLILAWNDHLEQWDLVKLCQSFDKNLSRQFKQLQKLLDHRINEKYLHELRKSLRQILEWVRFLLECSEDTDLMALENALKGLNQHLGDWQDRNDIQRAIKIQIKKHPNPELNTLMIRCKAEKRVLFQEVRFQLKVFRETYLKSLK